MWRAAINVVLEGMLIMSQQELSREVQEIWSLFRETNNQIREVAKCQKEQPYTIFIENLRHPPTVSAILSPF